MAGISISAIVGDNGIIEKAKKARKETNKSEAQEKLELELINLGVAKDTDANYNSDEYLTEKLISKEMIVSENLVTVDGWLFEIDRSVPEIKKILGEVDGNITISLKQQLSGDNFESEITGTIISAENLKIVNFDGASISYTKIRK